MKPFDRVWAEPLPTRAEGKDVLALAEELDLHIHRLKEGEATIAHRFLVDKGDKTALLAITRADNEHVSVELYSTPEALRVHGDWPQKRALVEVALARLRESLHSPRTTAAVSIEHGTKTYSVGGKRVSVLNDFSHGFEQGKITAVVGGSGKSTLLYVLAGRDRLTRGRAIFGRVDLTGFSDRALRNFSQKRVVFLNEPYAALNPRIRIREILRETQLVTKSRHTIAEALEAVGLRDKANAYTNQLSGGQRRLVVLARAFFRPTTDLLVADDPTAGLSPETASVVMNALRRLAEEGRTVILATNDTFAALQADRVIVLAMGAIASVVESPMSDPEAVRLAMQG